MSDGTEEGPDPNQIRRHAKKIYTEKEYRLKYRRIDWYRPNRKQLEFHNLVMSERMLRAGNQEGKTHAAAAELAMHATQLYPRWFKGRTFLTPPPIERPFDFLAWYAAPSAQKARDGMQAKLFGNIMQEGVLGTGLIPLDYIVGKLTMVRGVSDFIDSATIRREGGDEAVLRGKTYEQGRQAFEGEAVDVMAYNEDIKGEFNGPIYSEGLARLTATNGIVMVTMTPMLGLTTIRKRFKEGTPGTAEVVMTIDDALVSNCGHIPDEQLPALLRKYKAHEIQTRLYGADMQGEGAVFDTPVEMFRKQFDPAEFPDGWRWIWGLDFRHSGSADSGHPFAAVLLCHSGSDGDVVHVVDAIRMRGLPELHVARIKASPYWRAPVAWPHDGGRGASMIAGGTIAQVYKKLDLHMLPTHATFDGKSFDFESGISDMERRFASGRLIVRANLQEVLDEYQGYHRLNGVVNKIDDDLPSAIRVGLMDLRFAQAKERFFAWQPPSVANNGDPRNRYARGSPHHPDGEYDIFTGRSRNDNRPASRGRDFDLFSGR